MTALRRAKGRGAPKAPGTSLRLAASEPGRTKAQRAGGPSRATERCLPLVEATPENVAPFGVLIGTDVANPGLPIPFYASSVIEGRALPFACEGPLVVRTARISERSSEVRWLERHLRMTQIFVGLGDAPFVMVLGKPTHERGLDVPVLSEIKALLVPSGHGLLIHRGTWHEFPMAWRAPVTVLTVNSREVVETLTRAKDPRELDEGDVRKVDVAERLRVRLSVSNV